MSAFEWAEPQSRDHGHAQADPHAEGGDNKEHAREPVPSYGARSPNSLSPAANGGHTAPGRQSEMYQGGQTPGEVTANSDEAGEPIPASNDANVPANVLKDKYGGAMDPLSTVAKRINAWFDRANKADEKAENYRISAGQELAKARERVEAGEAGEITWRAWCANNIKRSEGDIRKVLAIATAADPSKKASAERQRNREAVARHRHRAYVSAVSDQRAVSAKEGGAVGTGPMSVTIDTVKRDIQLLSAAERGLLVEWLAEIVATEERGTGEPVKEAPNDVTATCAVVPIRSPALSDDPHPTRLGGDELSMEGQIETQPITAITAGALATTPETVDDAGATKVLEERPTPSPSSTTRSVAPEAPPTTETPPGLMTTWELLTSVQQKNVSHWVSGDAYRHPEADPPAGVPKVFVDQWVKALEPEKKAFRAKLLSRENSRRYSLGSRCEGAEGLAASADGAAPTSSAA